VEGRRFFGGEDRMRPLLRKSSCWFKLRSAALRAGDMCGCFWSVGTSPSGRRTHGYADSPLRGVCPPGTETPCVHKSSGHAKQIGMETSGRGER
jgi:hypothetical protein